MDKEEEVYIFEGKTTNEAIEKGLKELKTTKNRVEITVLESEEKRSFFSILEPRVVKVQMKFKNSVSSNDHVNASSKGEMTVLPFEEIQTKLDNFLNDFISTLPTRQLEYTIDYDGKYLKIDINGDDSGYLIGYRGEVLNSLQDIISNIVNNNSQERIRVVLNIGKYREKRTKDLNILADKIAKSVMKTGKSITLEPMSAFERKVIHTKLQEYENIDTHSIGEEPNRKVVIELKK